MSRQRVVIVGAGFAGYHAAKTLHRLVRDRAEIVLVNPTDYFLTHSVWRPRGGDWSSTST